MIKVKEVCLRQLFKVAENSRITLSGEVNILTTDIANSILLDDELYLKTLTSAQNLRKLYPYIKIDVVKELHELTIKFFAFNRVFIEPHFMEILRVNLNELVVNIHETPGLNIKVNLNGQIKTWATIIKFMVIDNKNEIQYKITETLPSNGISKAMGRVVESTFGRLRGKAKLT